MAPLGTDDEAAGTAPSGKAVAEALREELKTPVPAPQPLGGPGHAWLLILVIVLFAAAMVGATLLWR